MAEEIDAFHADMAAAGVKPLWERTVGNPREPKSEPPHIWRWAEIEPLIDQAVAATDMDNAERRVLSLANPDFNSPRGNCVTTNLNCGFQTLMPGETARIHRHTANALRFVLEGGDGETLVEGKPCPMNRGDLIITPGGTWHEHTHKGDGRIVWLDALDVPFHRAMDTQFFDPGPAGNYPPLPPEEAWRHAGMVPQPEPGGAATSFSPKFHYRWDDAHTTLMATPAGRDGARKLRYTNPATGGAAMDLFDVYLIALSAGRDTIPFRTTHNAFCLVVQGTGVSTIGDAAIEWTENDVFTLPHWNWYSHNASDDAVLFMGTDREIMRRLGLLREEWGEG